MTARRWATPAPTAGSSSSTARPSSATPFRRLEAKPLAPRRSRWSAGNLGNLVLLLIELAAIAGFIWWGARSVADWRALAEPQPMPTAEPGSVYASSGQAVLPGGHSAPAGSDVPAHLRPLVTSLPAMVLPTPAPGRPSRLVIEKLGIDAPIVAGDGPEQLKMGVGHRQGTAGPGQPGNMVLSGHNDIYGEVFRHLDRLAEGDRITVYSEGEPFTYIVRRKLIVEPTDLSVLEPTQRPVVTLISCYPYLVDTHRIVVVAELAQ
ncbi:MAG: sortase [Anaerolineae bacterium]|jgi:sortase A